MQSASPVSWPAHAFRPLQRSVLLQVIVSLASIGLLTVLLLLLSTVIHEATAALLYMLVVLLSAMTFGSRAGLAAAFLAALVCTYYFIPPLGNFGINSAEDAIGLIGFTSVALLVGGLTGEARRQTLAAAQRSAELSALYELSQTLEAEVALDAILPIVATQTARILTVPGCTVWLHDADNVLHLRAIHGSAPEPPEQEEALLRAGSRTFGVLRISRRIPSTPLANAERELLQTIAAQVGLVLERIRLAELDSRARALAESDRLKSTLLALVSHDLRTPLAVIKGLVTSLLDPSIAWTAEQQRDLLGTINDETDRLNRIVGDLLEMSRIEAGAISQSRTWYDLDELILTTSEGLRAQLQGHPLTLDVPHDLPWVRISYAQIEQVLCNLLLNAAHYAPAGSPIEVWAGAEATCVRVEIRDCGPGVPPELREQIFTPFMRTAEAEQRAEGVGLGLAICKGLVEAHGGQINVDERPGGGAVFAFTLPLVAGVEHTAFLNPET
jgi:two-component system, OmpR family, sensor histidine kinase KdpD